MSSPYVTLGNRPLEQWKVTELREELKKRKLATKGLKEDLLKRLDEAVRSEQADAMDGEDDDASQSESPPDQKSEPGDLEGVEDSTNIDNNTSKKLDTQPELENVDVRGPEVEAIDMEKGDAGFEGKETKMSTVIGEAVSGSHSNTEEKTMDGDSTPVPNNDELPSLQEEGKIEQPDPNIQLPRTNESTTDMASHSEPNLQGSDTQDEAAQPIVEDAKSLQQDYSVQTVEHQVSEVKPDLGFQVTSDSVSTESVSIIEKNELKVDVITDNVQLELDVKHEVVPQPASNAVPDGGELHPTGVDEPLVKKDEIDDKKDVEEPHGIKDETVDEKDMEGPLQKIISTDAKSGSNMENVGNLKNNDNMDLGLPEKLSLDRSSGDDSMEEDIFDSKQVEYKSDPRKISDVESSRKGVEDEEDHVDVVGHDKPVEIQVDSAENETVLGQAKRKFHDKATGSNDTVKKTRRLNAEGLKVAEPQSVNIAVSVTPRGLSGPSFKRSGTDPAVNVETPKERIVPPSARPATNSLRIDRFLRPFTLKAVQELLGQTGTVTSFWMDHIKTHCYVTYSSVEEAVETRNAVYNLQWPQNGGRMLVAEFVDPQEVKTRLEAPPASPATPSSAAPSFPSNQTQHTMPPQPSPRQQVLRQQLPPPPLSNPTIVRERPQPSREPLPREQQLPARERINLPPPPPLPEKNDPPIVTLDDLFRKTRATPRIYYLPLSDDQVATKLKSQGNNVNQSAGVECRMFGCCMVLFFKDEECVVGLWLSLCGDICTSVEGVFVFSCKTLFLDQIGYLQIPIFPAPLKLLVVSFDLMDYWYHFDHRGICLGLVEKFVKQ